MATRVRLPAELRLALLARCAARHPHEACGFLLGRASVTALELVDLVEGTNRARDPRSGFTLEPLELHAAERAARARGLALVGLWHSHPERPAVPSAADRAGLAGTGLQLIVEVRAGQALALAAWDLAGEVPRQLTLERAADDAADSADTGVSRAGRP